MAKFDGRSRESAAKSAGKVRFIGFTGHKDPIVHVRKLAAERNFHFDSCPMPLNVLDTHFRIWCRKEIAVLG